MVAWWRISQSGTDGCINSGHFIIGSRDRIDHAVAKLTRNTGANVGCLQRAAVGRFASSFVPTARGVAAQAIFTGIGCIILSDGKSRPKNGITSGLSHHAAPPGIVDCLGMAGVTGVRIGDLDQWVGVGVGLRAGQEEIFLCGW